MVWRPTRWAWALVLLLASGSALAGPDDDERQSDFWPSLIDPGRRSFELAMSRGQDLLDKARKLGAEPLRRRVLQDALAAFRAACKHSPDNFRGWYRTAQVLSALGQGEAAVKAFKRVRSLRPGEPEVRYSVAFELGIAFSREGKFERAVAEYDRADRVLQGAADRLPNLRQRRATVHGNAAEALMALGRLDEAIQRYHESLSYQSSNLVRFGLAVAYDRDEQVSKAQQEMRAVVAADRDLTELKSEHVFFIPQGDVHYYYAMGYQARGELDKAKAQWQTFLQKLPKSQWAPRARAHLASLGVASAAKKPKGKRLAPVPSPVSGPEDAGARDKAAIRRSLLSYQYRMRSCYRTGLRKDSSLTGDLRLGFTVSARGRADRIHVLHSTLNSPTMHRCVVQAVRRIRFSHPISKRPVRMEVTLRFKP